MCEKCDENLNVDSWKEVYDITMQKIIDFRNESDAYLIDRRETFVSEVAKQMNDLDSSLDLPAFLEGLTLGAVAASFVMQRHIEALNPMVASLFADACDMSTEIAIEIGSRCYDMRVPSDH